MRKILNQDLILQTTDENRNSSVFIRYQTSLSLGLCRLPSFVKLAGENFPLQRPFLNKIPQHKKGRDRNLRRKHELEVTLFPSHTKPKLKEI